MSNTVPSTTPLCGARRPGWERPGPGRHRLPCMLPTGHTGAHRDALRQTWETEQTAAQDDARRFFEQHFPDLVPFLASLDADLMRDDAPQVNDCDALNGQCTGQDCQDPQQPQHHGPEHGVRVSFADEPLLPFELTQWDDGRPELSFSADGSWPALTLAQVDELLVALDEYAAALRVAREHMAAALRAQREDR